MKQISAKRILTLLIAVMLICLAGCAKKLPASSSQTAEPFDFQANLPEEPSFVEHKSIQSSFASPGDTTVTLGGEEEINLTGIPFSGRKEVFLNGYTLTLTGNYHVSPDAVLDIKPGEDGYSSTIDLTELTFDFSFLTEELLPEKPLIEVCPGVVIREPLYPEGVSLRVFPNILTVIQWD